MENNTDRRERTVYVSGMHPNVNEEMLYELFTQAGPIEKVILHEATDGSPHHSLVIFKNVQSVMYSIALLNGISLYARPLNLRPLRESTHAAALERAIANQMRTTSGPQSPPPSPEQPIDEQETNQHAQGPVQNPWGSGNNSTSVNEPMSPNRPKSGSVRGVSYRAGNTGGWSGGRNQMTSPPMYGGSASGGVGAGSSAWSVGSYGSSYQARPNYYYSGSPYTPYAYGSSMGGQPGAGSSFSGQRMPYASSPNRSRYTTPSYAGSTYGGSTYGGSTYA